MNRLGQVGDRFKATFKTVNGKEFRGQILQMPDTSRVSNFISARRYLRVAPNTQVVFGDVMIAHNTKYIIAEHGEGFYGEPIYRWFKMFEVDSEVDWYQKKMLVDSVTGASRMVEQTTPTKVYLSTQTHAPIMDTSHFPTFTSMAVCDKNVPVDDRLGNYQVTKSDLVLGVHYLEMKRL